MAWFLERPEGGVLVDLPKPSEAVFTWLEAHGGVQWIVLTHGDHAQHHAEFAARFPDARRVLGAADVNKWAHAYADATTDVEVQLPSDRGPVALDGSPIPLDALADAELAMLPQPGHTPGGFCLLYKGRYLFTGDHLSWSGMRGHLVAHRLQCWEDWERQTASITRLADWARDGALRFAWVLPGHGEWIQLSDDPSAERTAEALDAAVRWMRDQPPGRVSLARWVPFVIARTQPKTRFARLIRAVLGATGEGRLLPSAVRHYLPDHPADGPKALAAK